MPLDGKLAPIATVKAAEAIVGSLGNPSKMPGKAYGLPAAKAAWVPAYAEADGLPVPAQYGCPVGAKMAAVPGSTCAACYADERGRYGGSSVKVGQVRRLHGLSHPQWVEAMAFLINRQVAPVEPYFRWHDSGDLLGEWHLAKVCAVCWLCPSVQFWLPTREAAVIKAYAAKHELPPNLVIRLSATKIDAPAPKAWGTTSTVHDAAAPEGHACPAPYQGGKCQDCRACWNGNVANVSYGLH